MTDKTSQESTPDSPTNPDATSKPRLLIVGCGYVGSEVVRVAKERFEISALTRSESRVPELENLGVNALVGDWLQPANWSLPELEHILVSVPHRAAQDYDKETHVIGLQNLKALCPNHEVRLTYLSTTGVYGDCQDEIVNEDTPVSPTRIGPEIAVEAERWLEETEKAASPSNASWKHTTLRLAGIYGPGRVPLASKLRSGEELAVPQFGYLNLAHVHDIARMILQVIESSDLQHSSYVFSDGQPVQRLEFYKYLAGLCGVAEPRFTEPNPEDSRARRATSKRIDPTRIVEETKFTYSYPNFQLGLKQALQ